MVVSQIFRQSALGEQHSLWQHPGVSAKHEGARHFRTIPVHVMISDTQCYNMRCCLVGEKHFLQEVGVLRSLGNEREGEEGGREREGERERESKKPCEAGENGMNEKVGWVWVCVCACVRATR